MTSEERDARLTAYALNDPGVLASERQEIEALLANDPAAKQAVEETRQLAAMLTKGLAAEEAQTVGQAASLPVGVAGWKPIPRTAEPARRKIPTRVRQFVAAAVVLIAVAGGALIAYSNWRPKSESQLEPLEGTHSQAALKPQWQPRERSYLESEATKSSSSTPHPTDTPAFDPTAPPAAPAEVPVTPFLPAPLPPGPKGPGMPGYPGKPGVTLGGPGLPGQPAGPGRIVGGAGNGAVTPNPAIAKPADTKPEPGESTKDKDKEKKDAGASQGDDIAQLQAGEPTSNDRHPQFVENPFIKVEGVNALSTFGVDVDTASYSIVRRYLTSGRLPPPDAVRLEEMVNYFPYADKPPEGADPFAVTVEMAECPWQPQHRLVRLGLKAKPIANDKRPPSNLVFLIDVSGSMMTPERLPLAKASLKLLVGQLRDKDQVALVAYAGNSGLVLDSTSGAHKDRIVEALDRLEAGGSTHGSQGIEQAYEVAEKHFIKNGTNRVILCTDGDWNVGTTSTDALVKLIEKKRETGIFLSVFGFGFGNTRDEMLVKLSDRGNGNYAYVDTLREGHKVFVEQLGGTLVTVAKDVKVQVEFNPAVIKSYRLLGYEKRLLAAKDFHDDTKDAGEMGAGHVVTALYELVPAGAPDPVAGKVDPLRYQKEPAPKVAVKSDLKDEAFVVKMRHKKPDSDRSTLREMPVKDATKEYAKASEDFQFAAAVASFAMLLRDSQYKGSANYGLVLELAQSAIAHDPNGYRAEFIELVKRAKALAGK